MQKLSGSDGYGREPEQHASSAPCIPDESRASRGASPAPRRPRKQPMSAHRPLKSAMRQGASAYADGRRSGGSGPPLTPRSVNVGVTPGGRSLGVTGGAARPMAGCGGPSAGVSLELRIGRAGAAGVTVNAAVRGVVNDLDEERAAAL